jgi:uncharacterized protein
MLRIAATPSHKGRGKKSPRFPKRQIDPLPKDMETTTRICHHAPMKRDQAISRLQQHEADLKRLGVEHLYMFGSTARDKAHHNSDVDLFFDYQIGKLGVFELMDVKEYAAGILDRKTDIMTRDSLHKTLRQAIEATVIRVNADVL